MQIKFKSLSGAPFEVIECTGALGDTYDAALLGQHFVGVSLYTRGQVKVTRIAGVPNGDGVPYVWNAGGFSADRKLPAILSPGTFRFEVMSDTALYYCVRRVDRALMNYELVRAGSGSSVALKQGQRLFVADGAVDLRGSQMPAPVLILAGSGDLSLAVVQDVFGLIL